MDKRKLKSRNVLHKQLYSSTQFTAKAVSESTKENNIVRSVSAAEAQSAARKRKNSEIEENFSSSSSSPTTRKCTKKKKHHITKRQSDESSDKEISSPKHSTLASNSQSIRDDKLEKPNVSYTSSSVKRIFKRRNVVKEQSDESEDESSSPQRSTFVSSSYDIRKDQFAKSNASYESSSAKSISKRYNITKRQSDDSSDKEISSPKHSTLASNSQGIRDAKCASYKASYKPSFAKKISKRRTVVEEESDESSEEELSFPKHSTPVRKSSSIRHAKFAKPNAFCEITSSKRISENEKQKNSSKGSYIRGVLEALDKSPSKLSQSSNSSVEKYRRINLRTPMRSRLQRPVSKTGINIKKNDQISHIGNSKKSNNDAESTSVKSVSNKSCISNISNDSNAFNKNNEEEASFSDTDSSSVNGSNTQNKNNKLLKELNTNSEEKNSPIKSQVISTENEGNKSLQLPELSPLKGLHSPEKSNTNYQKKTSNENNSQIVNFFQSVGITLYSGDSLHSVDCHPRDIIQKMKALLSTDSINIEELIVSWYNYIDNEENLKKSLFELKIENDEGVFICSKAMSLVKVLLQIPQLHIQVLNSLFKKLIDAVITTDSSDDAPWAFQILQHFRFMELLVDPDLLFSLLEELLNSSPEWFQREIIIFIPDIVTDSQQCAISELLFKILLKNNDLTSIILECISNLTLTTSYREELREQILELLETNSDNSSVPSFTKFILNDCPTEEIALKSLKALRAIDLSPSSKEKIEESLTNQALMVNEIKNCIKLFKEVSQAALKLIKTSSEPVPLDVIILMLLYEITTKKKVAETVFYNHVKDGTYQKGLMYMLYNKNKEVVKNFQSTALDLAITFLTTDSSTHNEFAIEWLRNIFMSQSDTSFKQREIMEKLLYLMGRKETIVKNVLEVLCRMANDDIERQYLEQHAAFLRIFVEKIDNLQFNEVSILYSLLHGLCTQSEKISNLLNDDLSIIMQKQLCSSKVINKCKGVLGAVMAIKHLASKVETSDQAFELLKKTVTSLKNCIKSQALFYDQLGEILVNTTTMSKEFLTSITKYLEDIFVNKCLVEQNTDDTLVPKFGLNDSSMADSYYINFGSGKLGTLVPILFKLLRICNLQLSDSLESINAVLGCPVLMPEDLNIPEPLTADYIIYCINWFREIISGFVTQKESLLREQVLKRLDCLMTLQSEFVTIVSMCGTRYQPPHCYFNYFPLPHFVRADLKIGKKGNKKSKKENKEKDKNNLSLNISLMLPEWENWQIGSEMTVKNPAFFRKIDPKIIYLLDTNMEISSQTTSDHVTIAHVCFIIKELLGMFGKQASETFVQDLIQLLPKICIKFKNIISDLRQKDNPCEKEAIKLLLSFITTLFSWKEFQNTKYNILLRDGLRTLAGMVNESNALLRSCKDLVAEAYKYFESLSDIATEMPLALALVNICSCLMKHSTSFTEKSKDKQAKMAYGFLCLDWNTKSHRGQYNIAVKELLKSWMDNELDPLKSISSILEWLPEEAATLEKPQSLLRRLPSISKCNLYLLVKQLFTGLIKGVELSLSNARTDPERIHIWLEVATSLDNLAKICKVNKNNIYLIFFLRYSAILYQIIIVSGMPVLEINIKYQADEVLNVIKLFQKSGRFLRDIFCTARKDNNLSLLKLIPIAKSRREKFIFRVKGMLTANNSIGAFWMGNLLNKDLDGEEITSQSADDITMDADTSQTNDVDEAAASDIFNSDSDDSTDVESE